MSKNSERKSTPPSSLDKEEPGGDRTELSSISKITLESSLIIKDKLKAVLSQVQSPNKPQSFGPRSHPTPDPSFEMIQFLFKCIECFQFYQSPINVRNIKFALNYPSFDSVKYQENLHMSTIKAKNC